MLFKVDLEKRRQEILYGNLLKAMMVLSLPTLMMGLVSALIPLSDAWFANNLLGNDVFAAISYSQSSINVMAAISQGLSVVAMAMIGKVVGEGNTEKVKYICVQILMLGLIIGLCLMPLCHFVAIIISRKADIAMQDNVLTYISLYQIVMPFYFMAAIFNAIKNVTGNPEAPFYRMIVLFVLKLFFNYLLLKILRLGIHGVVFASFLAYLITGVWMYYDLFIKKNLYRLQLKGYRLNKKLVKEIIVLGIPSMLSTVMINLGFLLINIEIVKYGITAVTALGIASQINNLCFILPTCISTSVTTMVSMNLGLNQKEKAKKAYNLGLEIGFILTLIMLIIVLTFDDFFIGAFTNQPGVIRISKEALSNYTYSIIPYSFFIIGQAVLNAMGKTKIPLFMGILRVWIIRYIFILATQSYLGYFSVFYGNLLSNIIAGAIMYIIVYFVKWESVIKIYKKD